MSETTTYTFIPNFTKNEQLMQKLWAKSHPSKGKGTRSRTSVSCNHPIIELLIMWAIIETSWENKELDSFLNSIQL